ncbi:MAG: hypothetical protein JO029_16005 [Candidatus Eremiobacteraeota bacterium]|nr:hypothetical protein [Candidatus Eremiobacteraeota bacterium]MBV8283184.1 hypothetical protein [Candidatus Eremiobacteraeota bacterium]MBV8332288.1 hypothetical protein [Candidatus Eremiobacteraeota bacterium]MBV8435786.1 hypothetical protein [Candidatus Eremiobacteraeota bacterium]MBV8582616.1 hypothetical protein [Candidatus Eremiobacteraeota bacterium]
MGLRILSLALLLSAGTTVSAAAFSPGPSCGEKIIASPAGVGFRILFANNGSVQQYVVTAKADDPEAVNDARVALEQTYGPAGIDAPPLKIISFRPGDNGMQVPDKAIDSCGRTLDFH